MWRSLGSPDEHLVHGQARIPGDNSHDQDAIHVNRRGRSALSALGALAVLGIVRIATHCYMSDIGASLRSHSRLGVQ